MEIPGRASLPEPGDRLLGKYRVERVLGQGGAGVVFAAHHELLDKKVALKLLLAEANSETAVRFVNEAKLAAKIHSEHVCRVMDVGTLENGLPFIAMEYLEGQDLDAVLAARPGTPLPLGRACDYVMQALEAIAQAHAQGIVHRDLKPSNLFLATMPAREMPIVKVLDFGISKGDTLGGDTDVTSSRAILGSPSYMSPEQIKNARTVDARTDIWSIGVILYELSTGHAPFGGETVGEVFTKIIEGDPPSPRELVPTLPPAFEEVVLRCLRRDREQRYSNVSALADALAPFAAESGELLKSIHGAASPLSGKSVREESKSTRIDRTPTRSQGRTAPAPNVTHSPWTEAQAERPRRRGRGVLLLVLLAFVLGGVTVFYISRSSPLANAAAELAGTSSAAANGSASAAAIEPNANGANQASSATTTGVGAGAGSSSASPLIVTPPPSSLETDSGSDAGATSSAADLADAGDAGGDAALDGGDDGGDDDDDEEVTTPVPAASGGKPAAPRPKSPTVKPTKKKHSGKRRRK